MGIVLSDSDYELFQEVARRVKQLWAEREKSQHRQFPKGGGGGDEFWAEVQTTPSGSDTTLICKRWDLGSRSSSGDSFVVNTYRETSDGSSAVLVDCFPTIVQYRRIRVAVEYTDESGAPVYTCVWPTISKKKAC